MNLEEQSNIDQEVLNKTTASIFSPESSSLDQFLQRFTPSYMVNEYQCVASSNSRNHPLASSAEIRTERTAGSLLKNKIRRNEK